MDGLTEARTKGKAGRKWDGGVDDTGRTVSLESEGAGIRLPPLLGVGDSSASERVSGSACREEGFADSSVGDGSEPRSWYQRPPLGGGGLGGGGLGGRGCGGQGGFQRFHPCLLEVHFLDSGL